MADGQARVPPLDLAPSHPATICYTAGTTGDPKGAVLPHGSWHDALAKVGSAGLPIIHGGSAVIREDGTCCEPGEVGEILISGPQLMVGYWNNPEASAQALQNGWLHRGDMGVMDHDGYLKVVDRAKDMLISGGLNVYPAEIERLLTGLDGMVELAVIGVPHQRWGETPMVIANTGGKALSADQVMAACRGKLADYKMPRYLLLRDEALPRGMSGKVLKRELRDEYATLPEGIVRLDQDTDKNTAKD